MKNLTQLDEEVLAALAEPGTRLRWYSHKHSNPGLAGRGLICCESGEPKTGNAFRGVPLSGYTVRRLIASKRIVPYDRENARRFSAGDPTYRDFKTKR